GRGGAARPPVPDLAGLRRALPPGAVYAAATLEGGELFLLVADRAGARVARAAAAGLEGQLAAFRRLLEAQVRRYTAGLLSPADRADLDAGLEEGGHGPLGAVVAAAPRRGAPRPGWGPGRA